MKKRIIITIAMLAAVALLLAAGGCTKKRAGITPPPSVTIGIAGFYQPTSTAEMLAGYMPEGTPAVDSKIFPQLDSDFEDLLRSGTNRDYYGTDRSYQCIRDSRGSATAAFGFWMNVGKCMNVDLLLVPQVHAWQEREGGDMGAERPAAVVLDFFLLDVKNQSQLSRSRYDERQKALAQNILEVGKFIDRGGKWVTAHELAREGMKKAIKELGL